MLRHLFLFFVKTILGKMCRFGVRKGATRGILGTGNALPYPESMRKATA